MDKCVVKRGENVSDAENFIAFTHLRSELNLDLFGLLLLSLTRCHFAVKFQKFEAEMVLSTPQKHTKGSSSAETEAKQKAVQCHDVFLTQIFSKNAKNFKFL